MSEDIEIEDHNGRIGSITFDKSPRTLIATRTASGFEVQMPIDITLRVRLRGEPIAMVSNLRGNVLVKMPDGSLISVGTLVGDFRHMAGISTSEPSYNKREERLRWSGTFVDLAYIEKARNGEPPQFHIHVVGDWSFLLRPQLPEFGGFIFLTEPQRFHSKTAYIELTYSREIWVDVLRRLGVAENVLVEVPLPPSPGEPWNAVWQSLTDARNAFERGGTTGWQATVTAVRHALDAWRKIEGEDSGPGGGTARKQERELRTKQERFDALRWHLLQAAHHAPHSHADEWTRDDALLMLASLSALLAVRKP
jgi:hypothetical protein